MAKVDDLPTMIPLAVGAAWLEPDGDVLTLDAVGAEPEAVQAAAADALGLVEKSGDPLALPEPAPEGSYPLYDLALVRHGTEKATRPTAIQTLIFSKDVFPTEAAVRKWIKAHPDFRIMGE